MSPVLNQQTNNKEVKVKSMKSYRSGGENGAATLKNVDLSLYINRFLLLALPFESVLLVVTESVY